MQRVITAIAAYFVILRGRMFNVGDRIVMAGVRGDVVSLGFIRTTIMEMGRPPALNSEPDASWVEARQYTGRIVTVTNDKIFDEPIYNYSRGFPYIWEELHLPVSYRDDRQRAEQILLEAAQEHGVRDRKDAMSRYIIQELDRAGIGVASATYEIVGLPPVRVEVAGGARRDAGSS